VQCRWPGNAVEGAVATKVPLVRTSVGGHELARGEPPLAWG
jgi:hypothetical protein